VKNAVCDVLIVQTSALDEDRIFGEERAAEGEGAGLVDMPSEVAAGGASPVSGPEPGGRSPTP
jgi:hypothetical protein